MRIKSRIVDNDIVVMELAGSFNFASTTKFAEERKRYTGLNYKYFVIDFHKVNRVESVGFRELLILLNHIREHKGEFVFCDMSDFLSYCFESLGIKKIIKYCLVQQGAIDYIQTQKQTKPELVTAKVTNARVFQQTHAL